MTEPPTESPRRGHAAGALLVLASIAVFAALNWATFRPARGIGGDFTQDWLAARDHRAGSPAYGDLGESSLRHLNAIHKDNVLRWNAHPPVSILFFLPLAELSHEDAFFVWNLLTMPLFAAAVWVAAWQLGVRGWRAGAVAAAVVLAGALPRVGCFPLQEQVLWGQFSAPITFLIAVGWAADRGGRPALAGAAVGLAAAIKLFPAFLLLYFVLAGRWRAAAVAAAVAVALNGLALAVFGTDAFRTYVGEVVPGVAARFGSDWANISVRAFWLRLFDPSLPSRATAAADAPLLGRALELAVRGAMTAAVAWRAWRAKTVAARDRAFAAAAVAMVLVSPISWSHSLILLVVPVGVLARDARGPWRWPLLACLVILWMPLEFITGLVFGREFATSLVNAQPRPLTPAEVVFGVAATHHALVGLFVLTLLVPRVEPAAPVPIINPDHPPAG